MCTEQNVTVGVPESEGRRRSPRTMSMTVPHVSLLVEASLKAKTARLGSKVSLLSRMKVRVARVRNELVGDVRNVGHRLLVRRSA